MYINVCVCAHIYIHIDIKVLKIIILYLAKFDGGNFN